MKNIVRLMAGVAGGLVLWGGIALADDKPADCSKPGTPGSLDGQVMKVDQEQGKLIVRAGDGTVHEFQTSKETLQDYKVGDPVKAKLRCEK